MAPGGDPRKLGSYRAAPEGIDQLFVKQYVQTLVGLIRQGTRAMDNLPTWVVTIAAVAVGLMPGLAIFSASSIASCSTAHCCGTRRKRRSPDLSPDAKNRPSREPRGGEGVGGLPALSLIPRAIGTSASGTAP